MQHDIAIAIVAFNRPASLQRLLASISRADYSGYDKIHCYINIDFSGDDTCWKVARDFSWTHGSLHIHQHVENLGLKQNVMLSAGLSQRHDAVIVLEDDLMVSPAYYQYAQQALSFFQQDDNIAGIALYANSFNEVAYCTFDPVDDGHDNYFMQVPCSWGQMWTAKQWNKYLEFLNGAQHSASVKLPDAVASWPELSSWKKQFFRYMIATNKYFVYPRVSMTTNFADAGKHIAEEVTVFQSSLLLVQKKFNFNLFDQSFVIYDAYFEFSGLGYKRYTGEDIEVAFDINLSKNPEDIQAQYLITARQTEKPIKQFASSCYPYEVNVLLDIQNENVKAGYLSMTLTKDVTKECTFSRNEADLRRHFISMSHARAILDNAVLPQRKTFKNIFKKFMRRLS